MELKKQIRLPFILVLIVLLLSSCAKSIWVHKEAGSDTKKVKGIPFYIQKGIIKQETKYLHWWYEITLVRVKKDGEKTTEDIVLNRRVARDQEGAINELRSSVLNSSGADNIISQINALRPDPGPNPGNVEIVSNFWKPDKIIDYETKYYLNAPLPWFGTSTFASKLNTDGTLGEASSTVDTQIDDFILSALPISDILSSALNLSTNDSNAINAFSPDPDQDEPDFSLKITISQKGFLYNFSEIICDEGPCDVDNLAPIPFDLQNGNYTRSNWPSAATKKKSDKPTINVQGSIQLPEKKK